VRGLKAWKSVMRTPSYNNENIKMVHTQQHSEPTHPFPIISSLDMIQVNYAALKGRGFVRVISLRIINILMEDCFGNDDTVTLRIGG